MQIYHTELSEITRYIEKYGGMPLEQNEGHFRRYMHAVEKYKRVDASSRILEVGTGTGWFPLLCKLKGLNCKGLEISPALIECARDMAKVYGVEIDIELGNLEEFDLGSAQYDVIIASNIFEHVEHWRAGLQRIHDALRPGGAMFFESTNKFSFSSGEYPLPLYGWLPDRWRYRLRQKMQGEDVMKLGIDFNQFTYPLLRREFEKLGFSGIYDRVEMADTNLVSARWKKWVVEISRRNRASRALALTFADATRFVCVK